MTDYPQWNPPLPPPPPPAPVLKPSFTPGLITALVASVAIAIGSAGTWASMLMFSVNGTVDPGGKFTLALGLVSAAVLTVAGFTRTVRGACYVGAIIAGVLALGQGLYSAVKLTAVEDVDVFGAHLSTEIGWGLWLVLIASVALIVSVAITYKQSLSPA